MSPCRAFERPSHIAHPLYLFLIFLLSDDVRNSGSHLRFRGTADLSGNFGVLPRVISRLVGRSSHPVAFTSSSSRRGTTHPGQHRPATAYDHLRIHSLFAIVNFLSSFAFYYGYHHFDKCGRSSTLTTDCDNAFRTIQLQSISQFYSTHITQRMLSAQPLIRISL